MLVYGGHGFLGERFIAECKKLGQPTQHGAARVDDLVTVARELDNIRPEFVVSFVGRTHGPGENTIDYLEGGRDKLQMNVRDNLFAPVGLALLCMERNIHLTQISTGCCYSGYSRRYREGDPPDFFGSSYSIVKGYCNRLLGIMPVFTVRIRMPITEEEHPRDFITKIISYEKVINRPNSMTVLPDLLPLLVKAIQARVSGPFNWVNPGSVAHRQILDLYKTIVDPQFRYQLMTIEEQNQILKSERSNCVLSTAKIQTLAQQLNHPLPRAFDSIRAILTRRANSAPSE